jgi:hypothetical protein
MEVRLKHWNELSALPEHTTTEIEVKKQRFRTFTNGSDAFLLSQIAAIPIAQFYVPKTPENKSYLVTDSEFRRYWVDGLTPQSEGTATALAKSIEKRFFHWFLEFPDIIAHGGFDCILGNPPYLGGWALSGTYGYPFCGYLKWNFAPTGISDLIVYFLRRMFGLLKSEGFTAFITTNSIKDGDNRRDGLEQVLVQSGVITMAVRQIKWPGRANLVVSLLAIHKGNWLGPRVLDGRSVFQISPYLEDFDGEDKTEVLRENKRLTFEGSKFLGMGFVLTREYASALVEADPRNAEVIFPVMNGQEINNSPQQQPSRSIINFHDWSLEIASTFVLPFAIVERLVKPERMKQNDLGGQEAWWRFLRPRNEMYAAIRVLKHCFATSATTKFLNFSALPTDLVFTHNVKVFATDRWDLYAVVQSTHHEVWARKYSGALETRLTYAPSDCFENFPFPDGLLQSTQSGLVSIGERYHGHRKSLMLSLVLGLTDIYNLFHARDLTSAMVAKVSKKSAEESACGFEGLLELRRLHVELDHAIRDAYGWQNLPLEHGFCEVETLAENDRVRYTISPAARKEVLRRLLKLNHERAVAEKSKPKPAKATGDKKSLSQLSQSEFDPGGS